MDFPLYLVIFFLGLIISILSGMIGIGGGIIIAPALLYIPPALQVGQSDRKLYGRGSVSWLLGLFSDYNRNANAQGRFWNEPPNC